MNSIFKGVVILLFTIVSMSSFSQGVQNQTIKFSRLLRLIDSYYVDSTNLEDLAEVAIIKMLAELDPHSVYISKEDVKKMNEPLKGSFDGIGISFNIHRDTLLVIQTIAGGPSEKVGLMAGDRILSVDDENIAGIGLTNQMVFDRLKGERGTLVTVKIKRKNETELLEFDIIRGKIPIYSLDASYMINESTGYVKLNRFSATTTEEFKTALNKLKENKKFENLVLDLRGNGGGYLKAAFEISDQFLDFGRMIVYTEGLKNPRKEYKSTYDGGFKEGKVAVLIDGGSASASEIVSGCIQDWDRGLVIGRRSFGKGLVQQPYYLTDGSMIRLTTAHYYTPSGRCIQKSYEKGGKDYRRDYQKRLDSGELFSMDSLRALFTDDSLVYKTKINNRDVFGGGGIIPDIFVALDTSRNYRYYNLLVRRSIVNRYVLDYVDQNREKLHKKYPEFSDFRSDFEVSGKMLEDIWKVGETKGIERNKESIEFIEPYAKKHMKAIIARDLWAASEYYEIINSDDDEILKAIEVLSSKGVYTSYLNGRIDFE